jgi:hypothetical protein
MKTWTGFNCLGIGYTKQTFRLHKGEELLSSWVTITVWRRTLLHDFNYLVIVRLKVTHTQLILHGFLDTVCHSNETKHAVRIILGYKAREEWPANLYRSQIISKTAIFIFSKFQQCSLHHNHKAFMHISSLNVWGFIKRANEPNRLNTYSLVVSITELLWCYRTLAYVSMYRRPPPAWIVPALQNTNSTEAEPKGKGLTSVVYIPVSAFPPPRVCSRSPLDDMFAETD